MHGDRAQELPRERDAAVSVLFQVHQARLVGLARLIVDDLTTAEDVVQDAFLALYRRWFWLREQRAALSYLQAAVVNGARSTLRRRRSVRSALLDPPPDVPSAESTVVGREEHRRLLDGLAALPLRQRQVLVLRYYLDQSEAEIAETLKISRGSVKTHSSRGLEALTGRLGAAR